MVVSTMNMKDVLGISSHHIHIFILMPSLNFFDMGNIIKLLSAMAALLSLVVKILTLSTSEEE